MSHAEDFARRVDVAADAIVAEHSNAERVLVAFGGIAQGVGMPPAEFLKVTEGLGARRILVRDPHRAFYQRGVDDTTGLREMATRVGELTGDARTVVLVGNSAGGTAALVIGGILNSTTVLAFSPVTTFRRTSRWLTADRRWEEHVKKFNRGPSARSAILDLKGFLLSNPPRHADIYFSEGSRLDRFHARRLGNVPGVHLRSRSGRDHNLIRTMRDGGELRDLLHLAITDSPE